MCTFHQFHKWQLEKNRARPGRKQWKHSTFVNKWGKMSAWIQDAGLHVQYHACMGVSFHSDNTEIQQEVANPN